MKTVLVAIVILGWSAVARAGEMGVVYQIDFGPAATCAKGFLPVEIKPADPRFFWKGHGLTMCDRGGDDLLRRDFISGERGEFLAGLDNGRYEVEITLGDRDYAHGPFNISVQGKLVVQSLTTGKAQFVVKTFPVRVEDEKLRIEIVPVDGGVNFAINSMIVRGPKQQGTHHVRPQQPPADIPTLAEIQLRGQPDPAKALKTYCDWLLAQQTQSGSFNPNSSEWYRTAYPVRTLLAGYDVFGDKRYLDAVIVCLDKLLTEQLPNAAWTAGFLNKPVARRTPQEIARAEAGTTNTADVGSISTCLAVAAPYVDEPRGRRYLAALRHYADDYAARWQLPSGAFTNARCAGKDQTVPYSVATGTQGMSFCALYAVTGEPKYLQVAQRAVGFLLDNWREDGRAIHHHHERPIAQVTDVTDFGDIYYYHEAILWVWHWTSDQALKEKIRKVYGWHIRGSRGLLAARQRGVWWPVTDTWTNSKAAAMPLVLIEYDRSMARDPAVSEAVRRETALLCNPDWAARIGILCDPEMPWGLFSTTATGFGGLTLAELVKPGVIYLKSDKVRLPRPAKGP